VQLCAIVRLLDVKAALETLPDKQRRDAALVQLGSAAAGGSATLVPAFNMAAAAVAKFRDSCGYRWINLQQLFGRLKAGHGAAAAAAAAAGV
jgi:hypothetical protein